MSDDNAQNDMSLEEHMSVTDGFSSKRPASPTIPRVSYSHKRRRRARNKEVVENGQYPSPSVIQSHVATSVPILTNLITEELPVAAGGYTAKGGVKKGAVGAKKPQMVAQLIEKNDFEYILWDG